MVECCPDERISKTSICLGVLEYASVMVIGKSSISQQVSMIFSNFSFACLLSFGTTYLSAIWYTLTLNSIGETRLWSLPLLS